MKCLRSYLFASLILGCGWFGEGQAAVVIVGGPGVVLTDRQPIQAVIVDTAGNTVEQTVYYNPALGGVDLDTSLAGANASVYFPSFGTGYVWYNGYWVDPNGYYWNGSARVSAGHPHWREYWSGYWGRRSHWHGEVGGRIGVYSRGSGHVHENIHNTVHVNVHETVHEEGGHHHGR